MSGVPGGWIEPLGLFGGQAARDAVEAGLAQWFCGGPLAYSLARDLRSGEVLQAGRAAPDQGCGTWAGLPAGPAVMGIINATPDSFSDGGDTFTTAAAIDAGLRMQNDGAAILDVGGESTRPGADPVPPEEEQRRTLPVVEALARRGARVSIDTRHADTMRRALDAGATIVNDVSGLRHDPAAAGLVAQRGCPVVLMHMRGDPRTMSGFAVYDDVALDVCRELAAIVERAVAAGVRREQIAVDPGFGFAKTPAQSRDLLARLPLFVNLSRPIIAGLSRKGFVGRMAAVANPAERDSASIAAAMAALSGGATVLRVHNVRDTVRAVRVWRALQA